MTNRYLCENRHCDWIGVESEMLSAPDPFDADNTLYACPKCRDQSLALACDVLTCDRQATCGWSSSTGYRHTCGKHMEDDE
jgi:hypothetical protein